MTGRLSELISAEGSGLVDLLQGLFLAGHGTKAERSSVRPRKQSVQCEAH